MAAPPFLVVLCRSRLVLACVTHFHSRFLPVILSLSPVLLSIVVVEVNFVVFHIHYGLVSLSLALWSSFRSLSGAFLLTLLLIFVPSFSVAPSFTSFSPPIVDSRFLRAYLFSVVSSPGISTCAYSRTCVFLNIRLKSVWFDDVALSDPLETLLPCAIACIIPLVSCRIMFPVIPLRRTRTDLLHHLPKRSVLRK